MCFGFLSSERRIRKAKQFICRDYKNQSLSPTPAYASIFNSPLNVSGHTLTLQITIAVSDMVDGFNCGTLLVIISDQAIPYTSNKLQKRYLVGGDQFLIQNKTNIYMAFSMGKEMDFYKLNEICFPF